MTRHREIAFEDEIVADMVAGGWRHSPDGTPALNAELGLVPHDLAEWVEASQPKLWEALTARHGAAAGVKLAQRVRRELDARGTLDVLRHGIDITGARARVKLAEFKPAMGLNPAIVARYKANVLRVARQVRYSTSGGNSLDLVLFVNGVPTATLELKSDFTQSVEDAVAQYRRDRDPRPRSGVEPMLAFPQGALVHFAVSDTLVRMTTRLEGAATRFLPFDRGTPDGGAGNPAEGEGHPTAYLWRDVLAPDSWLELIGRTIIPVKDDKGRLAGQIFPRFHQLDAVRAIMADVRERGPGGRYLIQHSAGSGKTNSIAWTAHFLADLHLSDLHLGEAKAFDTVIVVSDRKVIDGQLRAALASFERTQGVVQTVLGEGRAKSAELAEALRAGKKIVVCTIQTFPFALDEVRRLSAASGKSFAVIADEAHSSQTGQAAAKLREVLGLDEDDEAPDVEDILARQMSARAGEGEAAGRLTYVAFTATPKPRTMELFGTPPDRSAPAGPGNVPRPFHLYPMRQAIAEDFILDVLRNYTPYDLAFKLARQGEAGGDEAGGDEVDKARASASLMRWVKLHPYNVAQKVRIVVEHYRANVAPLLEGEAKAMVVVGSRLEAVRWKRAMDAYIAEQGYRLAALAAFSGEVNDPEEGGEPVTERGAINPDLRGRDIAKAFDTPAFQLLIVADKFQTGFDQPLLCAMYVDRRLAGVQAVQTLSRLNRCHVTPGGERKDETFVLDFANSEGEVLEAFSTYYGEATLEDVSDPDQIFDLAARLDGAGHYDEHEMERVVRTALDPHHKNADLTAAITPVSDRMRTAYERAKLVRENDADERERAKDAMEALELFRKNAATYLRAYSFLSQIIDYGTTHLARREIFLRLLLPKLKFEQSRESVDLTGVELVRHRLLDRGQRRLDLETGEPSALRPMAEAGSGGLHDPEKDSIATIIERMNELFGTETGDGDKVAWVNATLSKMRASPTLRQQAKSNSAERFHNSPDLQSAFDDAIIAQLESNETLTRQVLADPKGRRTLLRDILQSTELYSQLRENA